ncbi:hypothetical protein AMTR_s00008p00235300 [Amborella trichopoda]|uniref:Uncharacterized protein n=1 Tax=Amborella trichopoda TaxID=13333 RepID=W1NJQ3_AMBTC|nr:hypothetical protein AMTR_s00008p00235300 [Amborella trichopoda]
MELYFIVAILSAITIPKASVASPSLSSGSSKDALQLLSFKGFGKDSYCSVSEKDAPIEHGKLPLSKLDSRDLSSKGVNTKSSALSGHGDRGSATPRLKSSLLRPKDLVSGLDEVLYGISSPLRPKDVVLGLDEVLYGISSQLRPKDLVSGLDEVLYGIW